MSTPISHLAGNWPIVAAAASLMILVIGAIRYKIPELTKKVEAMEKTNHPTSKDLDKAFDSFRTACKFSQVTCQKGVNVELDKVRRDLDKKLSALYDLVNKQAIIIARVDERVATLHEKHDRALKLPYSVVND